MRHWKVGLWLVRYYHPNQLKSIFQRQTNISMLQTAYKFHIFPTPIMKTRIFIPERILWSKLRGFSKMRIYDIWVRIQSWHLVIFPFWDWLSSGQTSSRKLRLIKSFTVISVRLFWTYKNCVKKLLTALKTFFKTCIGYFIQHPKRFGPICSCCRHYESPGSINADNKRPN